MTVWGAFEPLEFAAAADGRSAALPRRKAAIVATGAYERGWPVPGWTLPGVMTTGAAQTLWRTARRLPGRRVLIAGNGPLNLQLAAELIEGGAEVVAVVEAAPRPGLGDAGARSPDARRLAGLVRDGLRYHLRALRAARALIYGTWSRRGEHRSTAERRASVPTCSGSGAAAQLRGRCRCASAMASSRRTSCCARSAAATISIRCAGNW